MSIPKRGTEFPEVAFMNAEPMIGPRDVAVRFGLPVSWVYSAAERGELPSYKIGKYVRFHPGEITAWLEARRQGKRP
jgi:excisionase family DNA binding protein